MRAFAVAVTVIVMLQPILAFAADDSYFYDLPGAGQGGVQETADLPLESVGADSFPVVHVGIVFQGMNGADHLSTRGTKEAKIYRTWSPSVVLVVTQSGLGSGVVVAPDAILTNAHVVGNAEDVAVIFKPAEEGRAPLKSDAVRGHVASADPTVDLALIRVAAMPNGVRPIPLGDEKEIEVGADVNAIGHPTGEVWTYTKGVISQYRKDYEWNVGTGSIHHADVIQTQTPINPGNSGGPLIATSGHLIGINAFKAEGEGLNFAIAITEVRKFLARPDEVVARAEPKCIPKILYDGRNPQNNARIRTIDWKCSGRVGAALTIPDDMTKPVVLAVSSGDDGQPDRWYYDTKRKGSWDYELISSKHDGKVDFIGYDIDEHLRAARIEPYHG